MTSTSRPRHLLDLRRLAVTHLRGDELFADDVFLSGRLLLRLPPAILVVPCADVATMLADLRGRREVSTATLLLRAAGGPPGPRPVVELTAHRPARGGSPAETTRLMLPAARFDAELRRLAEEARAFCAARGERTLVEDLAPLAAGS